MNVNRLVEIKSYDKDDITFGCLKSHDMDDNFLVA